MPSNALRGFLVPISDIVERPVEREPSRTWVKCTRANCTSPRFVQRADPDDTTCVACKKRDREYNHSKAGKKAKERFDENHPGAKAESRKRSDEKLGEVHVAERQHRYKTGESGRAASKRYKDNNPEKIKESMAGWNNSDTGTTSKAMYRDDNRDALNEKNLERKEERRNDPELRAYDQQVSAEWRTNNAEHIAEYNAAYYQANKEEIRSKHAERREMRRNDPELHAHDLQLAAAYRCSAAGKASRLRWLLNPKRLMCNARYRKTHRAELKAKQDEWNHSPMGLLARALCKMVKGEHWDPQSFPALGSFASNEEAMAHFEDRFEPWMSWENQGAHVKGNAYNDTWNIGHGLPRKIFDPSNEEDLRRCWSPYNLFPQCARQNTELRDALIYTDKELEEMRHLWPVAANNDLEQLKSLFKFIDHDFINSKMSEEATTSQCISD